MQARDYNTYYRPSPGLPHLLPSKPGTTTPSADQDRDYNTYYRPSPGLPYVLPTKSRTTTPTAEQARDYSTTTDQAWDYNTTTDQAHSYQARHPLKRGNIGHVGLNNISIILRYLYGVARYPCDLKLPHSNRNAVATGE